MLQGDFASSTFHTMMMSSMNLFQVLLSFVGVFFLFFFNYSRAYAGAILVPIAVPCIWKYNSSLNSDMGLIPMEFFRKYSLAFLTVVGGMQKFSMSLLRMPALCI